MCVCVCACVRACVRFLNFFFKIDEITSTKQEQKNKNKTVSSKVEC